MVGEEEFNNSQVSLKTLKMETKLNLMKIIYMRKLKMNESLEIKLVKISETYEGVKNSIITND